jgi:curved DNA-binding protein CbpA
MSDAGASPFAVLGIAPTADLAAIKRAYFTVLARHPPHADPEGFRRLRAAYETVVSPEGLRVALALAPADPEAELARYRERYDAQLAAAAGAIVQSAAAAAAGTLFKEAVMRIALPEALERFSRN